MNLGQVFAVLCFIIPGLAAVAASGTVTKAFNRAGSEYDKRYGRTPPHPQFTRRASILLGVGWLLGGILMAVLWR